MCKHFKSTILCKYFYDNQKEDSNRSTRQDKPLSVDKNAFDNDYVIPIYGFGKNFTEISF